MGPGAGRIVKHTWGLQITMLLQAISARNGVLVGATSRFVKLPWLQEIETVGR